MSDGAETAREDDRAGDGHLDDAAALALAEGAAEADDGARAGAHARASAPGGAASAPGGAASAAGGGGRPDGVVLAAARAHAATCGDCAARVERARGALVWLGRAAPATRAWCPPRAALVDGLDLAGRPSARHRAHVAACPACRDDVRDFAALADLDLAAAAAGVGAAAASPAAGGLGARLRARVVLWLDALGAAGAGALAVVESTLAPGPAPMPALARGPEQATPPTPTGAGAGPALVVLEAPFGPGRLVLSWLAARGAVDLRAESAAPAPRAWRLDLAAAPEDPDGAGDADDEAPVLLESRTADERGRVHLDGLAPGRYVLRAYGPQRRAPDLELELDLRT